MGVMFVIVRMCSLLNISLLPKSINPVRIGDVVGTLKLFTGTHNKNKSKRFSSF